MTWVAVAIGGAAVVGAGASVYAGRQAAGASRDATSASINEQRRQYDQTRADFAPQRNLGGGATDLLGRLYGINTANSAAAGGGTPFGVSPGTVPTVDSALYQSDPAYRYAWDRVLADQRQVDSRGFYHRASEHDAARVTADMNRYAAEFRQQNPQGGGQGGSGQAGRPDMSAFFESPDYQFNLAEGQKAIDRSLVARGRGLSGAGVREGVRYASGLASGEFNNYTNRLLTMAGLGNAATSSTAQAGANAANNNSAALIANGQNRGSAYANMAAGVNNSVQGGISNYMLMQYLNKPPVS